MLVFLNAFVSCHDMEKKQSGDWYLNIHRVSGICIYVFLKFKMNEYNTIPNND